MEYILYIDEAGCLGCLPDSLSNIQPVFCITGLIVPQNRLQELTCEFLELKRKFNPAYASSLKHSLEIMLYEIKGSDIRSQIRSSQRSKKRRAIGILDKTIALLMQYECKIIAKGYVKGLGLPINGNSVYTSSMQTLCGFYQHFLESNEATGIVVADSRRKDQNNKVSFSIFTQKYQNSGNLYPSILEMPLFGHSENHVGLQIADWLVSAILFPMITYTYCLGQLQNIHVKSNDSIIKERYSRKIKEMQYRYKTGSRYNGGIVISDGLGTTNVDGTIKRRSASVLFKQNNHTIQPAVIP